MLAEQRRPVIFGEVLFDRFPDGSLVLGGAPFNVAWHLQAFGQAPLLISRVGDDPLGRQVRGAMLDWGMDTAGLQLDSAHATGTVEVRFDHGEPSYGPWPPACADGSAAPAICDRVSDDQDSASWSEQHRRPSPRGLDSTARCGVAIPRDRGWRLVAPGTRFLAGVRSGGSASAALRSRHVDRTRARIGR